MDPSNIEAIVGWPRPSTVSKVRSFLGLACYYNRFVMDFSNIVALMKKLTCTDEKFVWTEDYEKSCQELEKKLTTMSVLTLPLRSCGFVIYSDALLYGSGYVLMQQENVVACVSRLLKWRE